MARARLLATILVLLAVPVSAAHAAPSRYALANRCLAVASERGNAAGGPFFLKPTGLGTYLIADPRGSLLAVGDGAATVRAPNAGPVAEWRAQRAGRSLALRSTSNGRLLSIGRTGALSTIAGRPRSAQRLHFTRRRGCKPFPEAGLGARGRPFRGTRRRGLSLGFADAHVHLLAELRAGGRVISGEDFDRFGIGEALGHDADVHGPNGSEDITGNLLRTGRPVGTHDTAGWPDFTGWPTHDTYTHQQIYYRWLQRAWLGGMRLAVAQLIEDQPLCQIEPSRSHSCDETDTIRLEVARLRTLQDYIDAQSGGPGRGWLRIVYSSGQARRAIAHGKLAVIIGVESSNPLGCSESNGVAQCDRAAVDRGLILYRQLGVRAMFITHWVDNAFGGAALEGGAKGTLIGALQAEQTDNPFMTGPCPEAGEGEEVAPLPGKQCNSRGLTELGTYLVRKLMNAHMLIEADHLSEQTRLDVLALAETRRYPLLSSHNGTGGVWTPSQLRRLHALGGYVSATLADAGDLAAKIVKLGRYGFTGVGIGTDTGGFNALPGPDPAAARDPLRYPFWAYAHDVRLGRQRTGTRTFDLNRDGVAHYGLVPDLLANVQRGPLGRRAMRLLFRSTAAYVQTWQRAEHR